MEHNKIKSMVQISLIAALISIVAPFTIPLPFSPVPISFTNLMIYLTTTIVGIKKATIALIVYYLIGATGLPVFSGFTGGIQKFIGPTGGYLIGFLFCVIFTGIFVEKFESKIYMYAVGMIIGTLLCYAVGSIWYSYIQQISLKVAYMSAIVPFLPGDIIKIIIATIIGYKMRKILKPIINS